MPENSHPTLTAFSILKPKSSTAISKLTSTCSCRSCPKGPEQRYYDERPIQLRENIDFKPHRILISRRRLYLFAVIPVGIIQVNWDFRIDRMYGQSFHCLEIPAPLLNLFILGRSLFLQILTLAGRHQQ